MYAGSTLWEFTCKFAFEGRFFFVKIGRFDWRAFFQEHVNSHRVKKCPLKSPPIATAVFRRGKNALQSKWWFFVSFSPLWDFTCNFSIEGRLFGSFFVYFALSALVALKALSALVALKALSTLVALNALVACSRRPEHFQRSRRS